jgi:hypothetical protein
MSAEAVPSIAVRCPNCGDLFGVREDGSDREHLIDVAANALLEHFILEHPGEAVGEGTTETAR